MSNKELVVFSSIISAGLITPEEYISCCDEIILNEDEPSQLVMDISLLKDKDEAARRLLNETYDNFEENYPVPEAGFFEACSEYLKYQSNHISWEEFLRSAILIAEHGPCQCSANDFNRFLEAFVASGKSEILAKRQSEHLLGVFKEELEEVEFYRQMVAQRGLTSLSS
ncbi:hypothetical protein [Marinobacter zhejiangensis]|uniref:Uncharacterized protein n=1 Tax=Marinobacter zhejiangensis TaxID=488535 RepID=A0A1I4QBE3_9GAMM|nr:hypothetical protein [Marinobacter zhejiangensis]SFM37354.1 hypothetical protein SAMN04487963_2293 [Marinobacter zhejiangensis]